MSDFDQRDVIIDFKPRRLVAGRRGRPARLIISDAPPPDKPIDCSAGDRPRVIISDTTAILLAEAFCDMANAKRLYVTGIEGAENFTRAFGELNLLQKALEADGLVA